MTEKTQQPVRITEIAKLIHTAIGFDEKWYDLGDTMGINRSREAAKSVMRKLAAPEKQTVDISEGVRAFYSYCHDHGITTPEPSIVDLILHAVAKAWGFRCSH